MSTTQGATAPSFVLGHRPALDGLRGVAVLLVVLVHLTYLLVPRAAGRFVPGAFIGVDIFFVLSGFLITTLLLEEYTETGRVTLRRFYARRARRLGPALILLLAAYAGYVVVSGEPIRRFLVSVTVVALYASNYFYAMGGLVSPGLGHTWSIAVEEQFYLLWPVALLLLLNRVRRRATIAVLLGVLAAGAAGVRAAYWLDHQRWDHIYVRTEARMDALLIGCILAVVLQSGLVPDRVTSRCGRFGAPVGALVIAGVVLFVHREDAFLFLGGFTVVAVAAAALVLSCLEPTSPLTGLLSLRPLRALGRASYGIYLWHVPVFVIVEERYRSAPALVRVGLGIALTFGASAASFVLVEQPMLRLGRRTTRDRLGGSTP